MWVAGQVAKTRLINNFVLFWMPLAIQVFIRALAFSWLFAGAHSGEFWRFVIAAMLWQSADYVKKRD
jgi:hypothetical protein